MELEKKLWSAADELRANSELKSSEYSVPVLGLIFLKYADVKFAQLKKELEGQGGGRRTVGKTDYHARGVLYLPEAARFNYLLHLPRGEGHRQGDQRGVRPDRAGEPGTERGASPQLPEGGERLAGDAAEDLQLHPHGHRG